MAKHKLPQWLLPLAYMLAFGSSSCRARPPQKNAFFMQCPYDLNIDAGNEVCASLLGIDQTKWSLCSDITANFATI
jgi:hypothetical protein